MITAHSSDAHPGHPLGRGLVMSMAVAAGLGVANIYYNQPMLGLIEGEWPRWQTSMVPTLTQIGYAAGLFLLVPLGDLVERKRLIVMQFLLLAAALVAAGIAPGATSLLVASAAVGVFSTVAQQIVPLAAHLASPARRGAVVGIVMSGLLCGILLSRTLAGLVATQYGWRAMFLLAAPIAATAGLFLARRLPRSVPDATVGYRELLGSLVHLWREFAALRVASFTQALLFAGFTAFWTILAFRLQQPRFGLGAAIAGLFGVIGAVGVIAAPIAGRIADRNGPKPVIAASTLLALAAWGILGLWTSLPGLIAGVILLDFAVQAALVSNQHIVYALRPEARARLNTLFMGTMFLGGAAGSAAATAIWALNGWGGVVLLGVILTGISVMLQLRGTLRSRD